MLKNILFITLDQWRADCVGWANEHIQTPNLKSLAQRGTVFRNHYAAAVPCGPSRASLLTGTYAHTHRSTRNGTPLSGALTNLALEARKGGLLPILLGYTDTTPDPRLRPAQDPDFRNYESVMAGFERRLRLDDTLTSWVARLRSKGVAIPEDVWALFEPSAESLARGGAYFSHPARFGTQDSPSALYVDEALEFLQAPESRAPWLLHMTILAPHPPFIAPAPYHAMYDPARLPTPVRAPTPEQEAGLHPYVAAQMKHRPHHPLVHGRTLRSAELSDEETQAMRACYYGMISEVDQHLGRLLDYCDEAGLFEDTLVVVTSDHGEMLGDHWWAGKYGFWDQAYHIPLVVCAPGLAGGQEVQALTSCVDMMPTLLDLAGLKIPRQCHGGSLRPFLEGKTPARWREHVLMEFDFGDSETPLLEQELGLSHEQTMMAVVRTAGHKLVHFSDLPPLFFDLARDPDCFVDVAAAQPEAMLRLYQILARTRMHTDNREVSHYLAGRKGGLFCGDESALETVRPA